MYCYSNNVESTITFDLGKDYPIKDLFIHGILSTQGVRIPKTLTINYSLDGNTYNTLTYTGNFYNEKTKEVIGQTASDVNSVYYSDFKFTEFTARYIKIVVGVNNAFSFDEIELYTLGYRITFNNADNTFVEEVFTPKDDIPTCSITPTYINTDSELYVFTGWDSTIQKATINKIYTAVYKSYEIDNLTNVASISADKEGAGSLNANVEKLIDNKISTNWGDGSYFGQTSTTNFVIDLWAERYWGYIKIHYTYSSSSGLVIPTFNIYSSNDENVWTKLCSFTDIKESAGYYWAESSVPTTCSRYIKIEVTKSGYMFGIDEIQVYGYRSDYGTNIASTANVTAPDGVKNDTYGYSFNGKDKLTDNKYINNILYDYSNTQYGVNGTSNIVFSFPKTTEYNIIRVHGSYNNGDGVRLPQSIKAYSSDDGESWDFIKALGIRAMVDDNNNTYYWAETEFDWVTSQYIKIEFVSSGVLSILDEIQIFGESEILPKSNIDRSLEKVEVSAACSYTLSGSQYTGYEDSNKTILTAVGTDDSKYVGFKANQQVSIVVDLGATYNLASFSLIAKQDSSIGAVFPEYITIYTSIDNSEFKKVGVVYATTKTGTMSVGHIFNDYTIESYFSISGRYVKFVTSVTAGTCYLFERVSAYSYIKDYEGIYPKLNLPTITSDVTWGSSSTETVNFVSGKTPWITVPGNVTVHIDSKNTYYRSGLLTNESTVSKYSNAKDIYNGKYFIFNSWNSRNVYFDFEFLSSIKSIEIGACKNTSAGVYAPNFDISLSTDGVNWYYVGTIDNSSATNNTINRKTLTLNSYAQARFVCVSFNVDQWVGIDEIRVYGTKKLQGLKVSELGYTKVTPEFTGDYKKVAVSEDLLSGVSDIYLAYHGYNDDITYSEILKDVAYGEYQSGTFTIKDTLYDGILFLAGSSGFPSGAKSVGGEMALTYVDYTWLIDDLLNHENKNIWALNNAVADMKTTLKLDSNYKVKFFVSLYVTSQTTSMTLEDIYKTGHSYGTVNLSTTAGKVNLLKWWIEQFEAKLNLCNYSNIEFGGYYWYEESISTSQKIDIATQVTSFIHNRGSQIFWIPYFSANGINYAEDIGFDLVCMQNNGSFNRHLPLSAIDSRTKTIKALGYTMEIELDYRMLVDPEYNERFGQYLIDAMKSGQMNTAINIYYMGNTFERILNEGGSLGKYLYEITYKYVKGTLTTADLKPTTFTVNKQNCDMGDSVTFTAIDNTSKLYLVKLYQSPVHGSVTINKDGSITYYADDDFAGTVTFTIVYSKYLEYSDPITITINVA